MSYTSDATLIAEGKKLIQVYPKVSAKLPKDLDAKALASRVSALEDALAAVKRANAERTRAVNAKNEAARALAEFAKRARATVKGVYGDDSTEYEVVGGKRLSERKRPGRKPKA